MVLDGGPAWLAGEMVEDVSASSLAQSGRKERMAGVCMKKSMPDCLVE